MIPFFKNQSLAIDLGNNTTRMTDADNILYSQSSCIVFDSKKSVKAIGDEAYKMFEKSHRGFQPVKPLKGGVIADYDSATAMIQKMVSVVRANKSRFSGFGQIVSGIPYSTTEVERRALRDALDLLGPRKRYLLFEPIAAALGMGINIEQPEGKMIIDIGGGITEIVILSLSGIVAFQSTKAAGDAFDTLIQDYFRRQRGIIIGSQTAERIKLKVGSVLYDLNPEPSPEVVSGKDIKTGIPVSYTIGHREIAGVLSRAFESIERCAQNVLETCPPELAADIYKNGIYVTGGGALIQGVKARLESSLQVPIYIDPTPLESVSRGASLTLKNPQRYRSVLV
ncbi:MAG: rod shape-determining protein [Cyclobacteriaceae bacterium]|nr:rod shape-determining protein [Cyclobacteriaceae bacterium]